MPDAMDRLRLEAPRSGSVAETAEYLAALETCYRHLAAFHEWADDIMHGEWRHWGPFPGPWLMLPPPDPLAPTEPALRISAVQMSSPGFWEFLGALNPLETIRKYLADRWARRQDREWRDPLQAERMRLENEQLRTQVVAERIRVLRDAGVPRSMIRRAVAAHVAAPLGTLDRFQDTRLIGGVLVNASNAASPAPPERPTRLITFDDDDDDDKPAD